MEEKNPQRKPRNSCPYTVKPFPKEWCAGCSLNGCYPWNRNPLLLCSEMGGLYPAIFETKEDGTTVSCCSCKPATEELWNSHLADLKREAITNEDLRLRAMQGKVHSSERLPADVLAARLHRKKRTE